jgi:hypothetical protein
MGNKGGKIKDRENDVEIEDNDYIFLTEKTGKTKEEINNFFNRMNSITGRKKDDIKSLFIKFIEDNKEIKLDKNEFLKIYTEKLSNNNENFDEMVFIVSYVYSFLFY